MAGSLSVTSPREWREPGCGEREGTGGEKCQPNVPVWARWNVEMAVGAEDPGLPRGDPFTSES